MEQEQQAVFDQLAKMNHNGNHMIFQIGINLDIQGKDVQAVIDLDTGLVGFVTKNEDAYLESTYQQGSAEYKKALFDLLLDKAADKNYLNTKISRKGALAAVLFEFGKDQDAS